MTSPPDGAPGGAARRAGIIGIGLIGGSIGLGLRRLGWHVTGTDRDPEVVGRALALGVIDAPGEDPAAEITFVATPVGSISEVAAQALKRGSGVVTDVGGVKASIVAAVGDPRFIGGHPMAGSERDGVEGADAGVFAGAAWVLTPTATTDPDAYARVHAIVSALGADVVAVEPAQHDAIVAVVSHVPHLTAAALMGVAAVHAEQQGALLRLAAGGFRDMTRISAGHPAIWPDVCADNADAITRVLDELLAELGRLRGLVADGAGPDLMASLEKARAARLALPARGSRRSTSFVEVRVPVPNREGVIAEVATLATDLGVNIEALETADATDHERGLLVVVVDSSAAARLCDALAAKGYHPVIQAVG